MGKAGRERPDLRISTSIHDQQQLEVSTTFNLEPYPGEQRRCYKSDVYMFIPTNIGVNSSTYGSDEFFRHRTNYFRLRTPRIKPWLEDPPEHFSLESAENYFAGHLLTSNRARFGPAVVEEAKLFGNFMHTRLKKLEKRARQAQGKPLKRRLQVLAHVRERLLHCLGLLERYRDRYIRRPEREGLLAENQVRGALKLTDEYISYRLEVILINIRADAVVDDPALAELALKLLKEELDYRRERGYLVLQKGESERGRLEVYTYRLGLLKKFVSETLFLELGGAKRDHLYRNGAAAVGAALAAFVAGLAERHRAQYSTGHDTGWRFWLLIAMAVAAYVFKDRVKDLTKEYFNTRLKHRLPDFRVSLTYKRVDPQGVKKKFLLGWAQEYIRYLKEAEAPPDVVYLRALEKRAETDPGRNEVLLHLARQFDFESFPPDLGTGFVKNVMRHDFSEFLAKLDDPSKSINFYDPGEGACRTQAPKVYHINLLMRHSVHIFDDKGPVRVKVSLERLRLVLNKKGLVRLETVVPMGEMHYQEVPA